jgi:hypothetical protein
MKLSLILLLVSVSAFAQQKKELLKKYSPVKFDSLDFEFDWDDVFRSAGWDCRCPDTTKIWQMPRESSPYRWVDKGKPIISDSTYQQWIKDDQWFKKFLRVDSTQLKKKKITVL